MTCAVEEKLKTDPDLKKRLLSMVKSINGIEMQTHAPRGLQLFKVAEISDIDSRGEPPLSEGNPLYPEGNPLILRGTPL